MWLKMLMTSGDLQGDYEQRGGCDLFQYLVFCQLRRVLSDTDHLIIIIILFRTEIM